MNKIATLLFITLVLSVTLFSHQLNVCKQDLASVEAAITKPSNQESQIQFTDYPAGILRKELVELKFSPQKYQDKSKIIPQKCFNPNTTASSDVVIDDLKNMLGKDFNVEYVCSSSETNLVHLITSKIKNQEQADIYINRYSRSLNSFDLNIRIAGGGLFGGCREIVAITKDGQVYFRCGSGKQNISAEEIYSIDLSSQEKTIAKSCIYKDDKKYCTQYCEKSSQCNRGEHCNLENNSCVKTCTTDSDCLVGKCLPLGPIMACKPEI